MQTNADRQSEGHWRLARTALACLLAIALAAGIAAVAASPACALSEIKREDMPGATEPDPSPRNRTDRSKNRRCRRSAPCRSPIRPRRRRPAERSGRAGARRREQRPMTGGPRRARPEVDPNAPVPEIIYDLGKLPEPVRRKRETDHRSLQERRHREAAAAARHRRGRHPAVARRDRRRPDRLPARALGRQGRPGDPGDPRRGAERRLCAHGCRHPERHVCLALFLRRAAGQTDAADSGSSCSRS